jgi:hypothetical protein
MIDTQQQYIKLNIRGEISGTLGQEKRYMHNYLIKWNWRSANWMTCIEHEKENILFGIVP